MVSQSVFLFFFFFQAEDGIRDGRVTGVQTCALPISCRPAELVSLGAAHRVTRAVCTRRWSPATSSQHRSEERRVGERVEISVGAGSLKKKKMKKREQEEGSKDTGSGERKAWDRATLL